MLPRGGPTASACGRAFEGSPSLDALVAVLRRNTLTSSLGGVRSRTSPKGVNLVWFSPMNAAKTSSSVPSFPSAQEPEQRQCPARLPVSDQPETPLITNSHD